MSHEKIRETILRLVPADGSPIGNGKMQTLLAEAGHRISEETYFIVRDRLIDEGKLKTGRGRGGSILRVADGAAAAPRGGEPAPATRAAAKQKGPVQKRAPKMAMPIIKRRRSALKKSELYSSLWTLCDELRGGMDASQYKDYVLTLLFVKYVSDKYAGQRYAPITIPPGASFADMVSLKGSKEIGDDINKRIIGPLARANKLSDMPDFNDDTKLGSGKEKVERLTNLIAIFENPALDFSRNRADGDDILGDAYEYLMRHFATESGKSKGQFYTPAEVSRIMAQILGIRGAKPTPAPTPPSTTPPAARARCCSRSATRPVRRSPCTARRRMRPPAAWPA